MQHSLSLILAHTACLSVLELWTDSVKGGMGLAEEALVKELTLFLEGYKIIAVWNQEETLDG